MNASRRLDFPPYSLWETRAGSGTPVVLLHGLSGSSRWWSRNIDALAAKYLVAAVDLVGFGKNRRFFGLPVLLPPFEEVASLLARWIETFGEPVHVIGHSMGGQIAIRLAAERPDLVRSLVLVDAVGMPFHLDPRPHLRAGTKPPYGGPGIARVLAPDFLRAGPTSVAVAGARVVRVDLREMMRAIRMPTLLVWGENDPLVPLMYGEAMQQEIAGSRLVVIPKAAHVAMWETPSEFNRIVLDFLDSAPPPVPARPLFSWGIAGYTVTEWTDGIAHRQAGRRRDIVLVHGLGMSSAYFVSLAAELFARGWNPIAPDLPGFGESANGPPADPAEHAAILGRWADALGIRDAVWLAHSTGCHAVAHVRRDLAKSRVFVGPLWTRSKHPHLRIGAMLALDAFREPLSLYRYVIPAYWRCGIAHWLRTWLRYAPDVGCTSVDDLLLAGERDPLPDRTCTPVLPVPGNHACVLTHPAAVATGLSQRGLNPI